MLNKKKAVNLDESYWREKYSEIIELHERFCRKLELLTKEMLGPDEIDYVLVSSRVKEEDSFIKKVYSSSFEFVNPIEEMVDISGIRIVLYSLNDVEKVCSLIERLFDIDVSRSMDKKEKMEPNEFGYLSIHKCISLTDERAELPDWSDFKSLQAEIQIRSILQHSWADISHKLDYKTEHEIPNMLRRQMFLLAGLLELADGQLFEIIHKRDELNQEIQFQLEEGSEPIPLETINLKQYLEVSKTIKAFINKFIEAGLRIQEDDNIQCILDISKKLNFNDIRDLEKEYQIIFQKIDHIISQIHNPLGITGARMNLLLCLPLIITHLDDFNDNELSELFYSQEIVEGFHKIHEELR